MKNYRKIVCGTAGDSRNVHPSTSREMHSTSLCFPVLMQACREIISVYFVVTVKNFANLFSKSLLVATRLISRSSHSPLFFPL